MVKTFPLVALSAILVPLSGQAAGWRADGTGIYPKAQPVLEWSAGGNVIWKTALPAWGNGMPVLVGDRIFLNVEPDTLVCLSAAGGKILWKQSTRLEDALAPDVREKLAARADEIAKLQAEIEALGEKARAIGREMRRAPEADREKMTAERDRLRASRDELQAKLTGLGGAVMPQTHDSNGYSSATPVSDGRRVFAVYGTGAVTAFDFSGKRLWVRMHEQPGHQWGHSTSPLLVDGRLVVHIKKMMALDPDSGDVVWTADVPESWGTSAVTEVGGVRILITPKGDIVRASDGAKLATGLFELPYGSPIVHEGVVYGVDEKGGFAFALPEKIEGDTMALKPLWTNSPPRDRYYSSPMVVDGVLFAMNRGQKLSAIDARTGEILFSEQVDLGRGQQLYGSFSLAGGHLFVSHDSGVTAVLKPGRTFALVRTNALEPTRSTPVFADGRMFFRTDANLYCIGRK